MYGIHKPAAAEGIQSKRQLLSQISRLYLEYIEKYDVPYSSLLAYGGNFWTLAVGPRMRMEDMVNHYGAEADDIAQGATKLEGAPLGLLSISTCSFCPNQIGPWEFMSGGCPWASIRRPPTLFERISTASFAVTNLITQPNSKAHFCSHADYDPLCFLSSGPGDDAGPAESDWNNADGLQYRAHIGEQPDLLPRRPDEIPAVMGRTARWYCPLTGVSEPKDKLLFVKYLSDQLKILISRRDIRLRKVKARRLARMIKPGGTMALDLDIYLPASFFLTATPKYVQGVIEAAIEEILREMNVPKMRRVKDVVRIRMLADSPRCEACDWNTEDL